MGQWTEAEIRVLKATWPECCSTDVPELRARSALARRDKGRFLGLPTPVRKAGRATPKPRKTARYTPDKETWVEAATEAAQELAVSPVAVMAGTPGIAHAEARRRAWMRLWTAGKGYSLAGIGRVSGFDHTSIRFSILRALGHSADDIRFGPQRFSLPRPPDYRRADDTPAEVRTF